MELEVRVGRVEQAVSGLQEGQDRLNDGMNRLTRDVHNAFQDLSSKLSESRQTNWATIIGVCGLLLVVMGGVGSGYVRDIDRIELKQEAYSESLSKVLEYQLQHITREHPTASIKFEELDKGLEALETNMRRELHSEVYSLGQRIEHLDEARQRTWDRLRKMEEK